MGQASGEHAACNQTCQTKCAAMPRTLFELLKWANPLHALRCWEDVWMTSSGGHVPFLGTYTQPGDACHPPMLWTRPVEPPCMRAASGCLVCDYKPRAHWLPAGSMLTTLTGARLQSTNKHEYLPLRDPGGLVTMGLVTCPPPFAHGVSWRSRYLDESRREQAAMVEIRGEGAYQLPGSLGHRP